MSVSDQRELDTAWGSGMMKGPGRSWCFGRGLESESLIAIGPFASTIERVYSLDHITLDGAVGAGIVSGVEKFDLTGTGVESSSITIGACT